MKRRVSLMLEIVLITLLTACAAPAPRIAPVGLVITTLKHALNSPLPAVYTVDGQLFDDPEALTKRDAACTTLRPPDFQQMIINTPLNQPIDWRISFNFKVTDGKGNPFGCLRLFEVVPPANGNPAKVNALDGGGFLINSCVINGAGVTLDTTAGLAQFAKQSYLQCATNLRGWVENLKGQLTGVTNAQAVNTMIGQQEQSYPHFVMYARGMLWPLGTLWQGNLISPIAHYQPQPELTNDPPVSMALFSDRAGSLASLYAFMNNTNYHVTTLTAGSCAFGYLKANHDWWMDFRTSTLQSSLRFDWRNQTPVDPNASPTYLCSALQPQFAQPQPLKFWIDKATLYIGYSPKTSYLAPQPDTMPEQWLNGALQELIIDPPDSKPPVS
ncbi:MAG: hypothetical protein U0350_09505 [Caldilineaceae bacterium]